MGFILLLPFPCVDSCPMMDGMSDTAYKGQLFKQNFTFTLMQAAPYVKTVFEGSPLQISEPQLFVLLPFKVKVEDQP